MKQWFERMCIHEKNIKMITQVCSMSNDEQEIDIIDLFVYDPNPPKLSHRPKSLMCINRQENQTLAFKSWHPRTRWDDEECSVGQLCQGRDRSIIDG